MPLLHEDITRQILAASFEVSNELGAGFLESVYEKALLIALQQKELQASAQTPINGEFRGKNVGQFFVDTFVENDVIVEIKSVSSLTPDHKAQLIKYLKGSGIEIGLLVNFGNPRLEYRRYHK